METDSGRSGGTPPVDPDRLRGLYRLMTITRAVDLEAVALQRQGILPGYAPMRGQEAAQVGSGAALRAGDFAFGTFRELGVAIARGVDLTEYMATHSAHWNGGLYHPRHTGFANVNAVVAGSVLHAVGWARAEVFKRGSGVSVAYFGDGASSEGEVHEAMNFAGLDRLPVVFFCQNNGWAISMPTERQVAGGSVAARAAGYGMPGVCIDGNDVTVVYAAVTEAVVRARQGYGPTVIEAMTYRAGPHSTSDDPGRYRSLKQEAEWAERDPLAVTRAMLRRIGAWDGAAQDGLEEESRQIVAKLRAGIAELPAPDPRDMFAHVFAEPTEELRRQYRSLQEAAHA